MTASSDSISSTGPMGAAGTPAATSEGTRRYTEKHRLLSPAVRLGRTDWMVSPVGFGGYRIDERTADHRAALRIALESGCNLIDTSTNYTNGSSELLVGEVLHDLLTQGKIRRDEIVVVTKAGYVQGDNLELARTRAEGGRPFPEMVEYNEDCWHCIAPDFLEDQINRSLLRLQLQKIDVLLLHNPEYFLKSNGDHAEYYRRIRKAFEYLETEVKKGRIQYYGISSNTFPSPKSAEDYTSLEAVWDIAKEMSPTHHFAVIQFPMNLFEPGAALEENNSGKTVAEFAREHEIGTLVNRPLNAFAGRSLIRLAEFPAHEGTGFVEQLKSSWTRAMELESAYGKNREIPAARISWGHILRHNFDRLNDIDTWKNVLQYQILPSLADALPQIESDPEMKDWVREYREVSGKLFDNYTRYLENQASATSDKIASTLDAVCPALATSPTLSQKAIRVYRSIPGIHCILLGMRKPAYVRDGLLLEPPVPAEEARQVFEILLKPEQESEESH